ncbi:MAG: DUF3363 domain-containing protein, partial [Alphaproteobacteria bacterium]
SLAQLRATINISGRFSGARVATGRVAQTGLRAHFAKGSKRRSAPTTGAERRVIVKARYVVHAAGRAAPLSAHVSYLARESRAQRAQSEPVVEKASADELGKSVDHLGREGRTAGGEFSFYDRRAVDLDAHALTGAWADDTRHFRLIVSAEDGEALGDLKPFIREVMGNLEARLGTRLEWVAVDHRDTDNPHTHVLIRGRRADGQDLFIPSKLISSGIRQHAQEVVTRVLGQRQGVDLARERDREIRAIDVTSLDRELLGQVRRGARAQFDRSDLIARLEQLERWDLAERSATGWRLADGLRERLTAMKERDQVEREVAHVRRKDDQALLAADDKTPVLGELAHGRLDDEFGDRFLAVVETGIGELRYARFVSPDDLAVLADAPQGAIVAFEPKLARPRASDEAVARVASRTDGLYSVERHTAIEPRVDQGLIAANVRRLEAMRRAGFAERRTDGVFVIPPDHLAHAASYEAQLLVKAPVSAKVVSYWSLAEQVTALGPTHLDHVLAGEAEGPRGEGGFGQRYAAALQRRRLFLIRQGWMNETEQRLPHMTLRTMAISERANLAKRLTQELGLQVLTEPPAHLRGVYARRVDLAQGRVAVIQQGRQAYVVPWRPALERFAGREIEGVMRGQTLSWSLARGMGPALPPMV